MPKSLSRILHVEAVGATVLGGPPRQVAVVSSGWTSTSGWSEPQLVRSKDAPPPTDGTYEFDFVAVEPSGIVLQTLTRIAVLHVLSPAPADLTGVRVFSLTNNVQAQVSPVLPGELEGRRTLDISTMILGKEAPFPWRTPVGARWRSGRPASAFAGGGAPIPWFAPLAADPFGPAQREEPILVGTLGSAPTTPGAESTGYMLSDVSLEVDMTTLTGADAMLQKRVALKGRFVLRGYIERGYVWTLVAHQAREVEKSNP